MTEPTPDNFGFRRRFDVFEEFVETAVDWDLDFRQLSPETAGSELTQIGAGGLLLTCAGLGCHCDQQGGSPKGFRTFALPAEGSTAFTWRGRDVRPDSLIVFGEDGSFEASSRPGFRVYTVSISESRLERTPWGEALLESGVQHGTVVGCHPGETGRLRGLVSRVIQSRELIARAQTRRLPDSFGDEVSMQIRNAFQSGAGKPGAPERQYRSARRKAVARALERIREGDSEIVSVTDLARELGVSERTLHRGFTEHFGIGPKNYLQALRLNHARGALLRAGPGDARVSEIALRFGFWHTGQFATDYRRLFGELPSQTLAWRK